MSITMYKGFYKKKLLSATYYLESTDSIMTALKEEFQTLLLSTMTTQEYANAVLENNRISASLYSRENEDYKYFYYEKTVSGKDFYYLATTHKSEDAFWLIQFACEIDSKDEFKDKFLGGQIL